MNEPFDARLRGELVAAADRRHVRRARQQRIAVLGVVIVLIGAVVFAANGLTGSDKASAGVDIKVENGQLSVRLTDLESRPDVIRSALEKAGLPVTITAEPVGPSNVGRFVSDVAGGPTPPPELHQIDTGNGTFAGFILPVGWQGRLDLIVGRPAHSGESYFTASNAFGPGEPLACSGLRGQSLAAASAHLPPGLVARAFTSDGTNIDPIAPLAAATAAHPDYLIAIAAALSPTDVIFTATPTGVIH